MDTNLKTLIEEKKSTVQTDKIKLDKQLVTDKIKLENIYSEKKQNLSRILADNYTKDIFYNHEFAKNKIRKKY